MRRASLPLLLLLLACAGALNAAAGAPDAGRALTCPIPTAALTQSPADHEPGGTARLDAGWRSRAPGAGLASTPPEAKAAGALAAIVPPPSRERRSVPCRPSLGFTAAQTTYLLTRRLRI